MTAVTTIIRDGLTVQLPDGASATFADSMGETTITVAKSPLVAAPRLVLPAEPHIIPILGEPLGGGFCAGPWPHDTTRAMVIAGRDAEFGDPWEKVVESCRNYRGGGFDDWRIWDRIEALAVFKRLACCNAEAVAFKAGGDQAFAEAPYWIGEEYQFRSGDAWGQLFGDGGASTWLKSSGLRARPFRIV